MDPEAHFHPERRAIADKWCSNANIAINIGIFGAPRKLCVDQKWFDAHDVCGKLSEMA